MRAAGQHRSREFDEFVLAGYRARSITPAQCVPTEKSVLVETFDFAGNYGIRSPGIMSVFHALLLTLRSCARSRAVL
jgi:hypothetical protein